jgi:hypothetical protein
MKFDSQKYIRMALENGYKEDLRCSYIRGEVQSDNSYYFCMSNI